MPGVLTCPRACKVLAELVALYYTKTHTARKTVGPRDQKENQSKISSIFWGTTRSRDVIIRFNRMIQSKIGGIQYMRFVAWLDCPDKPGNDDKEAR